MYATTYGFWYRSFCRMWLISPPAKATFVPGRIRAYTSACEDVRVKRGSMLISFAPRSMAVRIQCQATGWFSAGLQPLIMITSAFRKSIQWFVIAPRPNEVPRPGTVELCQSLA